MTMTVAEIDAPSTANTSVCVVALPSSLDPIRLVGDEEKHATLLFFGDMATLPADAKNTLLSTLGQATNVVDPFRESVRSIARLGEDDPPALVAMLSNRSLGSIRDMLLINPEVTRLLSNTKQHVGYIPHVTLGHPDYKGEGILREAIKPVYRVNFDRLALWWGDERIEFDLKSRSGEDSSSDEEFSMSEETDDFFAHYGVKGMRWGIRTKNAVEGGVPSDRKSLSEGQKKALKVGAGVAAIAGAAVVTGILAKNGKLPVAQLSKGVQAAGNARAAARLATSPNVYRAGAAKARSATTAATNTRGGGRIAGNMAKKELSDMFDKDTWDMSVKSLMDEISQAHRDETKYMKTNSAKSGMGYDPGRDNPYSPESRKR